jgi:phosphoribosyl-ATP pyrophosphohydrolase/phosphoribosyl-AMP cyclohydrolase
VNKPDIRFIADLETIVRSRLAAGGRESYTARLAASGTRRIAQKVGEEGVELALAATSGSENETIDEAADLLYHVIVLLSDRGLSLEDVSERLRSRHAPDERAPD